MDSHTIMIALLTLHVGAFGITQVVWTAVAPRANTAGGRLVINAGGALATFALALGIVLLIRALLA